MQEILIPSSDIPKDILKRFLLDRNLVFYPSENELYLKNNDTFYKISKGEGTNISISSDKVISLKDDISVKECKVTSDNTNFYYNKYLGNVSPNKQVLLILKSSDKGSICGNIQIIGENIAATYHLCVSNNGNYELIGASSFNKKDDIVKVSYLGQDYIGIKFIHGKSANVFLQGFDSREHNLDNLDYLDNQLIVNGP